MTEHGYKVEARNAHFSHERPLTLSDGILSGDWREVAFSQGFNPAGIPIDLFSQKHQHGLLSYEGAMALAWTLVAQNRMWYVETRIVQYSLETTFKCEKQGLVTNVPVMSSEVGRSAEVQPGTKEEKP